MVYGNLDYNQSDQHINTILDSDHTMQYKIQVLVQYLL